MRCTGAGILTCTCCTREMLYFLSWSFPCCPMDLAALTIACLATSRYRVSLIMNL